MKIKICIYLITTILLFSCAEHNEQNLTYKVFDLDSLRPTNVHFAKEFISHENFNALNGTDTIAISKTLKSIKTPIYIQEGNDDYQPDIIYSNVIIYNNNEVIFSIDSILTVGMYCYADSLNLLTIPVIRRQDSENLQTETDFYLCNINSGICEKINKTPIANSSYMLISPDGETLIYSDANVLYLYDVKTKFAKPIAEFLNPLISVYKLTLLDNTLNIYYFDDFINDFENNISMKKVGIHFPDSFFNS